MGRLVELDLTENKWEKFFIWYLMIMPSLTSIKLANFSFLTFDNLNYNKNLEHIDLSYNGLGEITPQKEKLAKTKYLDISNNEFGLIGFSGQVSFDFFKDLPELAYLNLNYGLRTQMSGNIPSFNRNLEVAKLAGNKLRFFPKFCEFNFGSQNEICKLRELHFDFNRLSVIKNSDLIYLENLEHLNMNHNEIEAIEVNSFLNLQKLETLYLSNNKLRTIQENNYLNVFNYLTSLKYLNLSSNNLSIVTSYLFNNLVKLEVIDLSNNGIYAVEEFAFYRLSNLRDLYLYANQMYMSITNGSFYKLKSIQSVYIANSVLKVDNAIFLFIDLWRYKNSKAKKKLLNRSYYQSLNLISFDDYDCNLTIYLIQKNVLFNLKTEQDWFNYVTKCDQTKLSV
jgi:Leucine-rich repeat (LRR) protein